MPIANTAADLDTLSWDDLARLAKHSETEIDSKLLHLGRLTSAALRSHRYDGLRPASDSPLRQAERLVAELDVLLKRLGEVVDGLAGRGAEAGNLHLLQRHRDILAEYSGEFRKTKEHAELVSSVREEINSYNRPDAHSYLLQEQERIELAQSRTDHVINIAYATQNGMREQRGVLGDANRKMHNLTERFPVLNQIMMKVRLRKKRDTVIMASFVGILLALTYIYLSRK